MTSSDTRPVCVLGAFRSGTSLVAEVLNTLGLDFGPEQTMLEASDVNPRGFWEQREIVELNEEILVALGGAWWNPPPRPPGWETTPELEPFRARIAELVERWFNGRRWGFKHPQTALTLPLWRSVVGEFDHVICLRNPIEVIESGGSAVPPGGDPIHIWMHYTCEALRLTVGRRRMFVFYEDWSSDPTTVGRELARFVNGSIDAEGGSRVSSLFDSKLHRQRVDEIELAGRDDIPIRARALYFLSRDLAIAERHGEERARALQVLAARMDGQPAH